MGQGKDGCTNDGVRPGNKREAGSAMGVGHGRTERKGCECWVPSNGVPANPAKGLPLFQSIPSLTPSKLPSTEVASKALDPPLLPAPAAAAAAGSSEASAAMRHLCSSGGVVKASSALSCCSSSVVELPSCLREARSPSTTRSSRVHTVASRSLWQHADMASRNGACRWPCF